MIETIYSNENGEGDRISKAQFSFKMPKNIRQVGKSNSTKKIYIEDYVISFIKQLAGGEYSGCSVAVLVGQCIKVDNCRNIFISGAVKVNDANVVNEIMFTNETWTAIYEDIKKYFIEAEIVGWYIGGPGYLLEEADSILKTHVDNFAGQDKVLLTYDNLEKEESFLCYENNRLCRQEGYYIYYEKNEEMQTYIIEHRKEGSCEEDYEDKVSKEIRTVIQNKKTVEEENKGVTRLMYAAGTLLAVIVLIIGAAMLRNYEQMKSMQDTLDYLSKNVQDVQAIFSDNGATNTSEDGQSGQAVVTQATDGSATDNQEGKTGQDTTSTDSGMDTDATSGDDSELDVQVVPGNVSPLPEETDKSGKEDDKDSETATDKELADDDNSGSKDVSDSDADKTADAKDDSKATDKKINYYTVVNGDTLADISYKLYKTYTKVITIMKLNGIEDQDLIYVGQKLIVP